MAAIKDYYGLITIIDYYFDKYYNKESNPITPYKIERYSTIQSFIFDAYKLLKSNQVVNSSLVELYINCITDLEKKILRIENTRLNKFEVLEANSSSIINLVIQLYNKYINRKFDSQLPASEQKSGYGNNYRQKIYIGAKLSEKNAINFDDVNKTSLIDGNIVSDYIVIDGTDDSTESGVSFNFYFNNNSNNRYTCNTLERLKEVNIPTTNTNETATGGTVGDLIFEQSFKDLENKKYFTYVVFQNGLVVDTYNEYENPIGICYDALVALKKDFIIAKQNNKYSFISIEEYLKNYFYKTLLEKYRTNLINDEATKVKSYDLNPQNKFKAIPYIYEKLNGRGGLINTTTTNGYGSIFTKNSMGYVGYSFTSSYYDHNAKSLVLNIPIGMVDDNLKRISKYKTYNNFLSHLSNRYYSAKTRLPFEYINNNENKNDTDYLKNSAIFINNNINDLKSDFLVENFFAIKTYFQPKQKNKDLKFIDFYRKNYKLFQKDYFYNKDYKTEIDFKFGTVNFTDKEFTNIDFTNNSNSYSQECLSIYIPINTESVENINLYSGILYVKKLTQTLADNDVSRPVISNIISRNHELEPNEFITALDDRDFEVIHQNSAEFGNYNGNIVNTRVLADGNITKVNSPAYKKTTLKKQNGEILLDCTDFSEFNDINTITQVRLINLSDLLNYNSNRYLFNVKNKKESYTSISNSTIKLDITKYSNYNISYFADNIIHLNTETVSGRENLINLKNNDFETFSISENKIKITYNSEKLGTINNIIINDELYINDAEIKPAYRKGISDEYSIKFRTVNNASDEIKYYTTNYLVLEENIVTKNILSDGQEILVEILDFIQSNSVNKKQLEQCIYNNDGSKTQYIYHKRQKLYIPLENKELIIEANKPDFEPKELKKCNLYHNDEKTKFIYFNESEFKKNFILKFIPRFEPGKFNYFYFIPTFQRKKFVFVYENKTFNVYMMDYKNLNLDFIIKYNDKEFIRNAELAKKFDFAEKFNSNIESTIEFEKVISEFNKATKIKIEEYKDGISGTTEAVSISNISRGNISIFPYEKRVDKYKIIDNIGIQYETIGRTTKERDVATVNNKIEEKTVSFKEETGISENFDGLTLTPKQS